MDASSLADNYARAARRVPPPPDADPATVLQHFLDGCAARSPTPRAKKVLQERLELAELHGIQRAMLEQEILREQRGGDEPLPEPPVTAGVALVDPPTYARNLFRSEQDDFQIFGFKQEPYVRRRRSNKFKMQYRIGTAAAHQAEVFTIVARDIFAEYWFADTDSAEGPPSCIPLFPSLEPLAARSPSFFFFKNLVILCSRGSAPTIRSCDLVTFREPSRTKADKRAPITESRP